MAATEPIRWPLRPVVDISSHRTRSNAPKRPVPELPMKLRDPEEHDGLPPAA